MGKKIKVLIVDDHEMVRMGLAAFIKTEPEMEVVGEANDGAEGIKKAKELKPDIVLMDLVMEGVDGISATGEILKFCPDIKIIVLTSYMELDKVIPAIEAGAFSYLLKTAKADEIADAVRKAASGIPAIEGKVANIMMNSLRKQPSKHEKLTQRELEVLKLLGKGMSNKEIGDTLFIGLKTVKTHVSNILAKLEVDDRTQAAIYANKQGLTDI